MAWWRVFRTGAQCSRHALRRTRLDAEALEDRVTPAAMSAYEASALQIVNQLRADPAGFANDLKHLYLGGTYQSPTGYVASDPIWTDLRSVIDVSEVLSSWRSGFTSTGANTFLSVASALTARGPLVWDSAIQNGAVDHDQWMFTNAYAHSSFIEGQAPNFFESPSFPIPGISRNFNVATADFFNYVGLGLSGAGENISYAYNTGGASFQAYLQGQISLDGYYQRLVYADIIGFVMEYNNNNSVSNPWGHLNVLTNNYNVVGISTYFYENPVENYQDGIAESYFSTHRLGQRSGSSYANILVYQDFNNNNVYDAGEGLAAQVTSTFAGGSFALSSTGYHGVQLPATGTYTVAASYQGVSLGSQQIVANGANKTIAFKVASNADFTAPTSQVAGLPAVQTTSSFLVQWGGSDSGGSGIASYSVDVSVDGGAFAQWQTATAQTQAIYTGSLGHTYGFYSVATDNAGNRQAAPAAAQATTTTQFVTSTTLSATPDISIAGTSVTLTAVVSPSPGVLGTVAFHDNGVPIFGASEISIVDGVATLQVSNLSVGTHSITADYSGVANGSYSGSASTSTSLTVNPIMTPTATTLDPIANTASSIYGSAINFTGTVSNFAFGTIDIRAGGPSGILLATGPVNSGSFNVLSSISNGGPLPIAAGTYSAAHSNLVAAYFIGSAGLADSNSAGQDLTVSKKPLDITGLTANDKPYDGTTAATVAGTPLLVGVLSGDAVTLGGTLVSYFVDANAGENISVVTEGFALTGLSATNYVLTHPLLSANITRAASQTGLVSLTNPALFGQPVVFQATGTAPGGEIATGSVDFWEGATLIGNSSLSAGIATFGISSLSVGSHSITAEYRGDANRDRSNSAAVNQVVVQAATTTLLTTMPQATTGGMLVTFTAAVRVVSPGLGIPLGTIDFFDGTSVTPIGSQTTDAFGVAIFTTSSLTVGTHPIAAVFGGSANFAPSTSNAVDQEVLRATTTTTLSIGSPNPSLPTMAVTFSVTVAGGTSTDGDSVALLDAGNSFSVVSNGTLSGGVASLTISPGVLALGPHNLVAAYSGNSENSSSQSDAVVQTIAAAPQLLSVSVNGDNPALAGVQRSRVASLLVVFDQAVQFDAGALTLALDTNNVALNGVAQLAGFGSLPTNLVLSSADNITWIVSFSGNTDPGSPTYSSPTDGFNSIKDGVYAFNMDAAAVHPIGVPSANAASNSTSVFYRRFGDTDAPESPVGGAPNVDFQSIVNIADNFIFRGAFGNPATLGSFLDFDGDGNIGIADNFEFRNRFNKPLTWSA